MSENDFTPVRAELPLDGQEAFRLASFGIEYVPVYVPVVADPDCADALFYMRSLHWDYDRWRDQGGTGPMPAPHRFIAP
jgi:hypothetical protein